MHYPLTKTTPWKHQIECWNLAKDLPAFYVAHAMGAGKTKLAVDYANGVDAKLIIIICPKKVISNWPRQFAAHSYNNYNMLPLENGSILKNASQIKNFIADCERTKTRGVVILNYERFWRSPIGPTYNMFNRVSDPGALLKVSWDLLIADEAHRIKAPSGQAAWGMAHLARKARRKLFLSGTPIPHSPLDLYAQFRALAPEIYGRSFAAFKHNYCLMGGYENRQVVKFINTEDLHRKFYSIAHRVAIEDAVELPPEHDIVIECALSDKARKIYANLEREFISEVEHDAAKCEYDDDGNPIYPTISVKNALDKLLRLSQLASGYAQLDSDGGPFHAIVDNSKIEATVELIEDLPPDEPVVIFTRFHSEIDRLKEALSKAGRTVGEISGRKNDLPRWEAGEVDTTIVQIQAGGEGIDTLKTARYCVYFSKGFSLGQYIQSRARINRPGQTRTVIYYHIIATGTVDQKIERAIAKKQDIVTAILDDIIHQGEEDHAQHRPTSKVCATVSRA